MNGEPLERAYLFWEHEGNRAIRQGRWKLVAKGIEGRWELYDMVADRPELHDLAPQHPQRVKENAEAWYRIALDTDVMPLDGRTWDERIANPTGIPNERQ